MDRFDELAMRMARALKSEGRTQNAEDIEDCVHNGEGDAGLFVAEYCYKKYAMLGRLSDEEISTILDMARIYDAADTESEMTAELARRGVGVPDAA